MPEKETTFELGPYGTRIVSVRDLFGTTKEAPTVGGLTIEYKSVRGPTGAGQVLCRGVLVQEKRGFSVSYRLHESLSRPLDVASSEMQAPAAYFGKLFHLTGRSDAYIHPHLLLRNAAKNQINIQPTLYGKDFSGKDTALALPIIKMLPEAVSHIDLDEERQRTNASLADGVAGLRLTYNANPTDLVADLINVDESGDFSLYDDVKSTFRDDASLQSAISFNLAGR